MLFSPVALEKNHYAHPFLCIQRAAPIPKERQVPSGACCFGKEKPHLLAKGLTVHGSCFSAEAGEVSVKSVYR